MQHNLHNLRNGSGLNSFANVKSAKLVHISELGMWAPDAVHGDHVRLLGFVDVVDHASHLLLVHYHDHPLSVLTTHLSPTHDFSPGRLFQFVGVLRPLQSPSPSTSTSTSHHPQPNYQLVAHIARDFSTLDTSIYDRCLSIRRTLESSLVCSANPPF